MTDNPAEIKVIPSIPAPRIASIDAYRGFVMLLMMAEVLSFNHVSQSLPGNKFWKLLQIGQEHVPWVGCSLHDLIQPSFSFLVGVALPYSIASRLKKGASFRGMLLSAIKRSFILIALGIFLRSQWSEQTYFTFEDTLTQIGLGYTFLFLIGFRSQRFQIAALVVVLVLYWLAFALYPLPGPHFNYAAAGVEKDWVHNLDGFAAHWNKNTNLAWAFDRWFLNLFPRESLFEFNAGGYATLSFIPTLGTMILGLLAGNILRSTRSDKEKLRRFLSLGIGLLLAGILIHSTGLNPIVKRIWTPAWAIFSGGCCFLLIAFFYGVVDVSQKRKWAFFLVVIGTNSIVAYFLADAVRPFFQNSLYIHLGRNFDQVFGDAYSTLVAGTLVLIIYWLILKWMYKKKLFIKV